MSGLNVFVFLFFLGRGGGSMEDLFSFYFAVIIFFIVIFSFFFFFFRNFERANFATGGKAEIP